MSNNLNALRKLAGLPLKEELADISLLKEELDVEEGVDDFVKMLTSALTVSIKPKSMEGTAHVYKGDISIAMTNGDKVRLSYKLDGAGSGGSSERANLYINDKSFGLKNKEGKAMMKEIKEIYFKMNSE